MPFPSGPGVALALAALGFALPGLPDEFSGRLSRLLLSFMTGSLEEAQEVIHLRSLWCYNVPNMKEGTALL